MPPGLIARRSSRRRLLLVQVVAPLIQVFAEVSSSRMWNDPLCARHSVDADHRQHIRPLRNVAERQVQRDVASCSQAARVRPGEQANIIDDEHVKNRTMIVEIPRRWSSNPLVPGNPVKLSDARVTRYPHAVGGDTPPRPAANSAGRRSAASSRQRRDQLSNPRPCRRNHQR